MSANKQHRGRGSLRRRRGYGAGDGAHVARRGRRQNANRVRSVALVSSSAGGRAVIVASGGDVTAEVALLELLSDRVTHANQPLSGLEVRQPVVEKPSISAIRSVTRLFASDVEDKALVPRPRLLAGLPRHARHPAVQPLQPGPGHRLRLRAPDPRLPTSISPTRSCWPCPATTSAPSGLPDAERERNLETLRFISDEAARARPALPARPVDARVRVDRQPGRQLHDRRA